MSGGIKAWENEIAVGPEDQGLELFTGSESAEEYLIVAYGLEEGLREFYLSMLDDTADEGARALFSKLAQIETLHQERVLTLYNEIADTAVSRENFAGSIVAPALEGGMTTDEYLARFNPDLNSITDILSLAMSIEAQALDLYQRASNQARDEDSSSILQQIADDERIHLQYLADYMDKHTG